VSSILGLDWFSTNLVKIY